jgi:DNA processing protein
VTIVGTRKASSYGVRAADAFSKAFVSRGVAVVSGMALGIDGRVHQASLDAGGLTVAILGCGADVVYPRSHTHLYQQILEQGVLLSELPPGSRPEKWTFPRRNRLLAALGDAALVVEGSCTSGAMQTADWCAELGRPVFAVPGPIFAENHNGCNQLIYEGAGLAADPSVTVEDFFFETRIHRNESGRGCLVEVAALAGSSRGEILDGCGSLSPHLESILVALEGGSLSADSLVEATDLSARQANVALAQLEIMGLIVRAGPGLFVRAP